MSDMTTELTRDDVIAAPREETRPNIRAEFMVYFAIIFVAALPLAMLTWAMQAIRTRSWTDKGPWARAWTQARIITPMIFSA
ncbi:MAG: cytochrome PufQ [Pseudomonadota bacterium]